MKELLTSKKRKHSYLGWDAFGLIKIRCCNQSLWSAVRKISPRAWIKEALKRKLQIKRYHDFFLISFLPMPPQLIRSTFTFYTSFFYSICEHNKISYGVRCTFLFAFLSNFLQCITEISSGTIYFFFNVAQTGIIPTLSTAELLVSF